MAFEQIELAAVDGVLTITLNRPAALNAFTATLHRELAEALKQADRDPATGVVVLTGAGRAFSAGQDLKEFEERTANGAEPELGKSLRARYNPILLRLQAMEKPAIAAVNGVAAGAGLSLALGCDLRFAADNATFNLAFSKIGLVPDSGAMYLLPRLVGVSRALELAWTARTVKADEALAIGLVNRVVAADSLLAEVQAFGAQLARGARKSIGLTKRGIYRAAHLDLESTLEYEAGLQEVAGRTADFREGLAAFKEKRTPRFEGS